MPTSRLFLGLMSGTSADAIDAALIRLHGTVPNIKCDVLHHLATPWPPALRSRLLAIMAPAATTTQELCDLNTRVAHHFAHAALKTLAAARVKPAALTAIGSHGQTVCHLPPAQSEIGTRKSQIPSTLQLGDPSVIATLTGITTVANFRPADMALGGQGAPLVPFTDALLLQSPTQTRCIQNIGGIANVTYLPKAVMQSGSKAVRDAGSASAPLTASLPHSLTASPVLAFDSGPGNMLLDALVSLATNGKQRFDRNGRLAARGTIDPKLFRDLQAHPYFARRPPKSTGREDFGLTLAEDLYRTQIETRKSKLENLLATVTELTAWSIADAYLNFLPAPPDEVILCGGGADNPTLVARLRAQLDYLHELGFAPSPIRLSRIDDVEGGGIPNKAKEATSFALLAAATLDGIPANLPSVTGASHPTLLGVIAPGRLAPHRG